jgi:hypothetical protein
MDSDGRFLSLAATGGKALQPAQKNRMWSWPGRLSPTKNSSRRQTATRLKVIVRDLRTGRVLHDVPTGTPPKPEPGSVGVGNIVALVLKSNGSVAWIAEDSERSAAAKAAYFDVYATDKSGTRLLASGTDIDPSSLALSAGATHLDDYPHTIAGNTLYWTQGGQSFSTTLN